MSEHTFAWASFAASLLSTGRFARTLAAVRRCYPHLNTVPSSLGVSNTLESLNLLAVEPSAAGLLGLVDEIRSVPEVAGALDVIGGIDLERIHGDLTEVNRSGADGGHTPAPILNRITDALRSGLTTTIDQLGLDERLELADIMHEELTNLGYHVDRADGNGQSGIWAMQEQRVIAVRVTDGGAVEIDVQGCAGGACRSEVQRLTDRLRRRGVTLQQPRTRFHADPAGGSLIRSGRGSARGLIHAPRRAQDDRRGIRRIEERPQPQRQALGEGR